ncbi:phage holin family protein [Candidatus Dojkabacteria bacterium]|nr:phage holin family protein [Candidatus Dojkabacteria bacterium]
MKTLIRYILRLLATAGVLYLSTRFLDGIIVEDFVVAITAVFILSIYNSLLRPIVSLLTLPINFITFGLFSFVANVLVLYAISILIAGFDINGILNALILSIILAIANSILDIFLK